MGGGGGEGGGGGVAEPVVHMNDTKYSSRFPRKPRYGGSRGVIPEMGGCGVIYVYMGLTFRSSVVSCAGLCVGSGGWGGGREGGRSLYLNKHNMGRPGKY